MITLNSLINEKFINIFTDASIYNLKVGGKVQEVIGCPGYIVVHGDKIIDQGYTLLRHSTNNISELYAILLGVTTAKYYKDYTIRLFSDSQLSIFAIRDRIFNWIRKSDGNTLYTVEGTPVSNQSYIMDIVYTILNNGVKIDLYHQKGHVNTSKDSDILNAKEVFKVSNRLQNNVIDDDFIIAISNYNNYVDNMTRDNLHRHISHIESIGTTEPFEFVYKPFEIQKYKELIYKGGK